LELQRNRTLRFDIVVVCCLLLLLLFVVSCLLLLSLLLLFFVVAHKYIKGRVRKVDSRCDRVVHHSQRDLLKTLFFNDARYVLLLHELQQPRASHLQPKERPTKTKHRLFQTKTNNAQNHSDLQSKHDCAILLHSAKEKIQLSERQKRGPFFFFLQTCT
jgi:hypothetical protein